MAVSLDGKVHVLTPFASLVEFASETYTATNAGVYRLSFPAEYISKPSQVRINSRGAATSATAFILSY